jgi:hypothetical protein
MYISLADSRASGFNKWCEVHDSGRKVQICGAAEDIILAHEDADPVVMAPPELQHRPWLVPGAGTL